jgi:outer membrane receptor for ferrienterochelin and colicin
MQQASAREIFAEIEKQTGLFFSYESSLTDNWPKLSLIATDELPADCLQRLFADLPVSFRITGRYIILKKKPSFHTVSGYVRDSASLECLIDATVVDLVSGKGVTSNSYGFFSLTLPAGTVKLRSSYVGYATAGCELTLRGDTSLDILPTLSGVLPEVTVKGANEQPEIMSSRMGNMSLSSGLLHNIPALFGEPDLFRTLQQMPGIASGTEMLGGTFVRGGNGDENLFLIDGVPVYNVNHVGGLFSTFNPDVVRHVDFYKGGFPARYGGRLSSVADVRMNDGDKQHYHGNLSIGLLAAKISLEGPIVKDRTSFNLAFRRTWLDALTTPAFFISNLLNKNEYEIFAGYSFYDLNAKINHLFSPRSRLYANFYMGQDRLRSADWFRTADATQKYGEELIWRWGNLVSSVNWTYVFGPRLFANFNASYSRYQSKMINDQAELLFPFDENAAPALKQTLRHNGSGIEDLGCRADFDFLPSPTHRIRFGSDYLFHQYRPEERMLRVTLQNVPQERNYPNPLVYAHEWSAHAEDDWLIGSRWKASLGARLAAYLVDGKTYTSFQPRLSLRYLLRENLSLKTSYVKMDQYVHRLSNTYANLPSEIWVPVTANVKPMTSRQISTGLYYDRQQTFRFSVEAYYKQLQQLIEYQDNALIYPDYLHWDERISTGSGRSYGIELMAHKPEGKTSGWIAYTLSRADRIFNDRLVNGGRRFPSRYDNRHKLTVTLIHKINAHMDFSASWMYASGNRVTVPLDSYLSQSTDGSGLPTYEDIPGRNAARLGDYHRLDISLNIYRPQPKGRTGIWNFSLYNAYSRMNPFYIETSQANAEGGYTLMQKGLIPVIPSVSYIYKF